MVFGVESNLAERWLSVNGIVGHLYSVTDPGYKKDDHENDMKIELDRLLLGLGLGYIITIIVFICELVRKTYFE